MNETKKHRLLTIKEAACLIDGLTEYRVRQMCLCGQIPVIKAGKKTLIAEETLINTLFGKAEVNSENISDLSL